MRLRFNSLEGRIVGLFLVLIVAVQAIGLLVIEHGINVNARSSIATELINGEKVFRKLMEQNAQKQRFSAQVLARDTAFVQAIGNGDEDDRATIASALANSGRRARADMTMLIDGERRVTVGTGIVKNGALEKLVLGLLDRAEQHDGASAMVIVDQRPVQVVVMPVKAPITIAWVVMGFALERQLVLDMRELSQLDVAIFTRQQDGPFTPFESTLAPAAMAGVARALQALPDNQARPFDLDVGGIRYSARLLPLGLEGGRHADVLLARSIDDATAEYTRLQRTLMILTIVATLVACGAAVITAMRIAQPLRHLAGTARRMERGDYDGRIDVERTDEIGALAKAFAGMRESIAKREQEIGRLAYWDALTDLPNRAQFVRLLGEALDQARQREQVVFVLMMDLDRFKHVNDVMGHAFGDALLQKVAERLRALLAGSQPAEHPQPQLARLGGDEFVVLLPASSIDHAHKVAAGILRALEAPLSLDDQTVDIGAGLGMAAFPINGADPESLLSMAEVAMYAAKQRNDGAVAYDAAMDKSSAKSLGLLTELRNAIERDEFRLHVQPKIRLDTGEVVGVESLVRWVHPERGNVFPDEFIPFAEQTGFIRVLTRWVLDQSAALCSELQRQGIYLKISVNLSTRDLLDQDLPAKFREILTRHQLSAGSFCLEITESAIMDDPVRAQQTLERLHTMGVDLSIDDFGTGYSSLAYLKRLPVDELKIDKSFVLNMENDIGDTKIVRSTIDLGHNMGLRVVAEGIESEAVWRLLAALGCDQGQGYFMSRPIAADKLVGWIAGWTPPARAALPYTESVGST
ncbi:EAL domain-containing protein [Massilia sp. CCM 8734]|uniref:putative bifunctional diguanylate cyclase/phosphodiesterase n=1 Tax=Massilia sp. CCM 8734 TaxID=2609283 RepID=UPI001421A217|nr:EAL domain-containing protein [Massilia sp. CCM 8734]NHZ99569.1 EAL domain-containing protein [Massilia sp. CCM 8734]